VGWGKVACWSTKAAISLKRVKIEEKLQRRAMVNALLNGTIPDPLWPPFPQDSGFAAPPKTPIAIISGTDEATDFKLGRSHWQGPSEQNPIKNFGVKGAWAYPGTSQFFLVPPIISGTGKATNFKFVCIFNRKKSPLKISRKVGVGIVGVSRNFSRQLYIYRLYRAVIFAIAQLSCFYKSAPMANTTTTQYTELLTKSSGKLSCKEYISHLAVWILYKRRTELVPR